MPIQLFFESANIDIEFDEENNWIYVNWKGFQLVDSVKSGCEEILKCVEKYDCPHVLNDNTLVSGVWAGAAEWGATNWFPRMKVAGVRKFAWIYSPSYFSKLSTDITISYAPDELLKDEFLKTFFNIEEAKSWLHAK